MKHPLFDGKDGSLNSLARSHLAGADLRPEAEDRLRRELEHGFERRSVRRKRAVMGIVVSLAALLSLFAYNPDVISDTLEILFRGTYYRGRPEFEIGSSGAGFQSALDSTRSYEEHHEFVTKAYEAKMAGEWGLEEIRGYTLSGITYYIVTYSVEVDGEIYNYHDMQPHVFEGSRWEEWLRIWYEAYEGPITELSHSRYDGEARELPSETVSLLGQSYEFKKYTETFPEYGEIIEWVYFPED